MDFLFLARPLNVRIGSKAVFPNSVQNVRSWVKSGPQFEVTEGLLVAEGVEEVLGSARLVVIPFHCWFGRGDRGDDG